MMMESLRGKIVMRKTWHVRGRSPAVFRKFVWAVISLHVSKNFFTRRGLASGTVHQVGMPSRIDTRSTLAHCTWTRRRERGRLDTGLEYECHDLNKCMRHATLPCKQGVSKRRETAA